ncbi:MAG: uroporphyrinogen decarboxylase family protein [Anaerolineae bacterium]
MSTEAMTSRERLMAAFRSQPVDRVPIKIWSAAPWSRVWHPSFQPILDLALAKTDLAVQWGMDTGYFMTHMDAVDLWESHKPSEHEGFRDRHTVVHTKYGDLHSVHTYSTEHRPGMQMKYPIESIEDARKFLSIPYVLIEPDVSDFFFRQDEMGERGIMIAQIDYEPIFAVQMLMGSELLAIWLMEERQLVREMVEALTERVVDRVKYLLSKGVGPVFGYYGPELCSPPLVRPIDFQEFVVEVDRKFTSLVKEAGGLMWVHSHGPMSRVLQGFLDIGVDCLNPIEPPPMGDVTVRQARQVVGSRMCLEGNIEADDMYRAPAKRIRELVAQAIEEARGGGLILCPTSGYMEWTTAGQRQVDNYRAFVEAGLEFGKDFS